MSQDQSLDKSTIESKGEPLSSLDSFSSSSLGAPTISLHGTSLKSMLGKKSDGERTPNSLTPVASSPDETYSEMTKETLITTNDEKELDFREITNNYMFISQEKEKLVEFDNKQRQAVTESAPFQNYTSSDMFETLALSLYQQDYTYLKYKDGFASIRQLTLDTNQNSIPTHPISLLEVKFNILCRALHFHLDMGMYEPFIFSIEIVDVALGNAISQRFWFHLGTNESDGLYANSKNKIFSPLKDLPKAIFCITSPNPNLYMVLNIEKVSQGPIDNVLKHYKEMKTKNRDEFLDAHHFQSLAFSYLPLFKTEEQQVVLVEGIIPFKTLYSTQNVKCQSEIYDLIANSKGQALKKDVVPGWLLIETSKFSPFKFETDFKERNAFTTPRQLSPSAPSTNIYGCSDYIEFFKLQTKNIMQNVSKSTKSETTDVYCWEKHAVHEFETIQNKYPHSRLKHDLIVNFESGNLNGITSGVRNGTIVKGLSSKKLNICVRVKVILKNNIQETINAFPHKITNNLVDFMDSLVYFDPNVHFLDQILIKIPIPIQPEHVIMFIFVHLPKKEDPIELGYCIVPLTIKEKTWTCPIFKMEDGIKDCIPINSKVNTFTFRTTLSSTLIPKETYLMEHVSILTPLLSLTEEEKKEIFLTTDLKQKIIKSINSTLDLNLVEPTHLISHYPLLLDFHFKIVFLCEELFKYHNEEPQDKREVKTPMKRMAPPTQEKVIDMTQRSSWRKSLGIEKKEQRKSLRTGSVLLEKTGVVVASKPEVFDFGFKKKVKGSLSTWKKRYFVLYKNGNLEYYVTKTIPKEGELLDLTKLKCKGKVNINGCSLRTQVNPGHEHCLIVNLATEDSSYVISFPDSQTCTIWKDKMIRISKARSEEVVNERSVYSYIKELQETSWKSLLYFLKGTWDESSNATRDNSLLACCSLYLIKTSNALDIIKMINKCFEMEETQIVKDMCKFIWFFFDIVLKSMCFYPISMDKMEKMKQCLLELMNWIGNHVYSNREKKELSRFINSCVCDFVCKLAFEMKLEDVFDLISMYLNTFDKQVKIDLVANKQSKTIKAEVIYVKNFYLIYDVMSLKVKFCKTFFEHDLIIPMNSVNHETPPTRLLMNIFKDVCLFDKRVKLYSNNIIIDEKQVFGQSMNIHNDMIDFFKSLIKKHDLDARYQEKESTELLGRVYFPFLVFFLSLDFDHILDKESYNDILLWILSNMNREWLMKWIEKSQQVVLVQFCKVLSLLIQHLSHRVSEVFSVLIPIWISIYKIKREDILQQSVDKSIRNLAMASKSNGETNLMTICLYIVALIVRIDAQHKLGFKMNSDFIQIHNELTQAKGELHWKWAYGITLSLIRLDETESIYLPRMTELESTIVLPEPKLIEDDQIIALQDSLQPSGMESSEIELDKNGDIKAASLEKLVGCLFSKSKDIRTPFFLTYRSFTNPYDLFDLLVRVYNMLNSSESGQVFDVLGFWLGEYVYDFDTVLICKVNSFLFGVKLQNNITILNDIKQKLENILIYNKSIVKEDLVTVAPPPKIISNVSLNSDAFDLTAWDPLELARQISLIEFAIFSKIEPRECFGLAWTKTNKEVTSPHIVELTNRFNTFSYWLATCIVCEEDLTKRIKLVSHILKVMQILRDSLHNFNAITTINSAFSNAAVFRLKKTTNGLSNDLLVLKGEMDDLVSTTGSYKNLRSALKCNPPCIPYLGVFLTDLTFIEEGNPNMTNGMINFSKRRKFAEVLTQLKDLQKCPYNFEEIKELQQVLMECKVVMDDKELYAMSLKIEPRGEVDTSGVSSDAKRRSQFK